MVKCNCGMYKEWGHDNCWSCWLSRNNRGANAVNIIEFEILEMLHGFTGALHRRKGKID